MRNDAIHLNGLNGIRAIAALAVVVSHITLSLDKIGLNPNIFGTFPDGSPRGLDLAGFGVSMFFTLSGFLITYLLHTEKKKTNNISIKKFYWRRLLRIWPLYYMYIIICIAVLSFNGQSTFIGSLYYYIFQMANVPFILGTGGVGLLIHYWSLGVEEQFYIFWPWLVKNSNSNQKHLLVNQVRENFLYHF